MRRLASIAMVVLAFCCAAGAVLAADAKVEEVVVGPAADDAKHVVSPRGGHFATVAHKGSRMVVVVDGVEGPKVDAVLTPVTSWVDPRPWLTNQGNNVTQAPPPAPVTFSRDGRHYAYLAQVGKEWVLMSDGKELTRMPAGGIVGATAGVAGMAGNSDIRMEFTGEDGKHLLLAKSSFNGLELWVDGQKWPGAYRSATGGQGDTDPIVSPDGRRIAYAAQLTREKASVIVDGKDAGYLAENLHWTGDSKHLIGVSRLAGGEQQVLIDGKQLIKAKGIVGLYIAPVTGRIVAVLLHQDPKSGQGQFLLVDGKPVEESLCPGIQHVYFSPDGKRYAAMCGRAGARFMVVDGKKGQEYQDISEGGVFPCMGPAFSADSTKFGYTALMNGKGYAVIEGEESDGMNNQAYFMFSPDGKHTVVSGMAGQKSVLVIDGKPAHQPAGPVLQLGSVVFSADGSHYAGQTTGMLRDGGPVVLDGKETGLSGIFSFSPDGKHLAVAGNRAADNKHGLFVDGVLVFPAEYDVVYRAFTADGQHLYWLAREAAKGPGAAPGSYAFVTYLDGKPVAQCEQRQESERFVIPRGFGRFAGTTPAWELSPDGTLTCLVLNEDTVKRVRITPGDSSLAALMADAQAAQAKGGKRGR